MIAACCAFSEETGIWAHDVLYWFNGLSRFHYGYDMRSILRLHCTNVLSKSRVAGKPFSRQILAGFWDYGCHECQHTSLFGRKWALEKKRRRSEVQSPRPPLPRGLNGKTPVGCTRQNLGTLTDSVLEDVRWEGAMGDGIEVSSNIRVPPARKHLVRSIVARGPDLERIRSRWFRETQMAGQKPGNQEEKRWSGRPGLL